MPSLKLPEDCKRLNNSCKAQMASSSRWEKNIFLRLVTAFKSPARPRMPQSHLLKPEVFDCLGTLLQEFVFQLS